MTKADLIDEVSRLTELTRKDSEVIVETIFESVVRSLRAGIENTWHSNAITVYRNWVAFLKEQKSHRRSPETREQRVSA